MAVAQKQAIGKNVVAEVKGDKLVIEIDLSQEFGKSSSGKSIVIASSEGNQGLVGTDGVKLGLNVYRPANR